MHKLFERAYPHLMFFSVIASLMLATVWLTLPRDRPLPSPHVKVLLSAGHGSGTHIGNGYILTASHVVSGQSSIRIKASDGREYDAELLWAAGHYDVAILRVPALRAQHSNVACEPLVVGQEISAHGNPLGQEFVTTWGRVSGTAMLKDFPYKDLMIVNAAVTQGMSGGGIFDVRTGALVGSITGVMTPGGFAQVSIGYVVPSSRICALLPRVGV